MKLSHNQLLVLGVVALVAASGLYLLGNDAVKRGSFSVLSSGGLATIPVDDEMLDLQESAFGRGGIYSGNDTADGHLDAMRDANRAYKSSKIYYAGSVAAVLVGAWLLFGWWRQRETIPNREP